MYVIIMLFMLQGNVVTASVFPAAYESETQCNKQLTDSLIDAVKQGGEIAEALQNRTLRLQCADVVEESV